MQRMFIGAVAALLLCVGVGRAEEIRGKVKSVDPDKRTITLIVDSKDRVISLDKNTRLLSAEGNVLKDGLKNPQFKQGPKVIVLTVKRDGKVIVSEVRLAPIVGGT